MPSIELELLAETKKAANSISSFGASAQKSLQQLEGSFNLLKGAAVAAIGIVVGTKVKAAVKEFVDAASVQEVAVNQLNTALKLSGDYSNQASKDIQEFASSLQATTTYGDEVILSQIALAKSFGITNDQAKDLVKAAADLSQATGTSLESAVKNLGKTYGGLTGELGETVPALKGFTQEQLKAGEAVDFVVKRFGGASVAAVNTYAGATKQLSNIQGDLNEEIGFFITKNPMVIEATKQTSGVYAEIIKAVQENKKEIEKYVSTLISGLLGAIPKLIKGLEYFVRAINGVQLALSTAIIAVSDFLSVVLEFDAIKIIVNSVIDTFKAFGIAIAAVIGGVFDLISAIPGADSLLGTLGVSAKEIQESIENLGGSLVESFGKDETDGIKSRLKDIRDGALEFSSGADVFLTKTAKGIGFVADKAQVAVDKVAQAVANYTTDAKDATDQNKKLEKSFDELTLGDLAFPSLSELFDIKSFKIDIEKSLKEIKVKDFIEGVGDGLNNILAGKKGAEDFLAKGVSKLADSVVPGLGKIIEPIMKVLMMGPEQVRGFIKEFFDAIPDLIVNVLESIPVIMPEIIDSLVDSLIFGGGLKRIVISLVKLMPLISYELVMEIIKLIPQLVSELGKDLGRVFSGNIKWPKIDMPEWISKIANYFPSWLKSLKLEVPSWLKGIRLDTPDWLKGVKLDVPSWLKGIKLDVPDWLKDVGEALGGGGGGGDKPWWKFAEGGFVPSGFPNDTFPAKLTSGELVVPNRTTDDLFRLINNLSKQTSQRSNENVAQNLSINLTIGEKQLADVLLNLNRQGFRVA